MRDHKDTTHKGHANTRTLPQANMVGYIPGISLGSIIIIYLIIGTVFCFYTSPVIRVLCMIAVGFYLTAALLRLIACLVPYQYTRPSDTLPDQDIIWPTYTLLVPLYQEASVTRSLVTHLKAIDYPSDKLEIIFICEQEDVATQESLHPFIRKPFSLEIVPTGGPRTKPNALNHALRQSRGELVTIYDAEDRPHPDQLKTAAIAFAQNPHWAALQAPLRFYNGHENWLTRQFALEYAALFYVWVPFLAKLGLPFPLGGTSNHIRGLMYQTHQHRHAFSWYKLSWLIIHALKTILKPTTAYSKDGVSYLKKQSALQNALLKLRTI